MNHFLKGGEARFFHMLVIQEQLTTTSLMGPRRRNHTRQTKLTYPREKGTLEENNRHNLNSNGGVFKQNFKSQNEHHIQKEGETPGAGFWGLKITEAHSPGSGS